MSNAIHKITPWPGNALHITVPLWGESTGRFPHKESVMRDFGAFLSLAWTRCWTNSPVFMIWKVWVLILTWWRHQMPHFPRCWPFVRWIHRSPVNTPHKGQWRGALIFSLICLNKRLSKQSWGWWFKKLSCPLWRLCNGAFRVLKEHSKTYSAHYYFIT